MKAPAMKTLYAPSLIVLSCLTSACATQAKDEARPIANASATCKAEGLEWAVGKPMDEATGRRLLKESGAGLWRIIGPNQPVTMDYRVDRINARVDADNRIVSLNCG